MTEETIAAGPNDVTVRAQFEYWMSDEGQSPKAVERSMDGEYKYMPANSAWRAWQAAAKAEREACAKLVSDIGDELAERGNAHAVDACDFIEDAIRMRSNAEVTGRPPGRTEKE